MYNFGQLSYFSRSTTMLYNAQNTEEKLYMVNR